MLHENVLLVLSLLFAVALLHMLSTKLRMSFPILLVIAGLALSLLPGLPVVSLDPDLVFLIFLPPLLYEAAWFTSWHDFKVMWRAIFLQAFGLVFFTSSAVALVAHEAGYPWALGFLLGGIISPPDAVAAQSVLKGLRVPRTAITILEGESLINDASSLIVYRFALAAIMTGHFSATEAAGQFVLVSGGGVVLGLALGRFVFWIHRCLPASANTDAALTVMTPYLVYLLAESIHLSGVLAVVSSGLYLSSRSHEFLKGRSRVQANGVWATLVFILNGLVFILIGLQLPVVVRGFQGVAMSSAIAYGVGISVLAIVLRLVWVFPAAYTSQIFASVRRARGTPSPKLVVLVGWAGMRGVVSLASALALPLTLVDGTAFPKRDLLVFITFVVILSTLVFQGLTLPLLIRLLRFEVEHGPDLKTQRSALDARLATASLAHLRTAYGAEIRKEGAFQRLVAHYEDQLAVDQEREGRPAKGAPSAAYQRALREICEVQRKELVHVRRDGTFEHELTREAEEALDLEAARLA